MFFFALLLESKDEVMKSAQSIETDLCLMSQVTGYQANRERASTNHQHVRKSSFSIAPNAMSAQFSEKISIKILWQYIYIVSLHKTNK